MRDFYENSHKEIIRTIHQNSNDPRDPLRYLNFMFKVYLGVCETSTPETYNSLSLIILNPWMHLSMDDAGRDFCEQIGKIIT